MSATSVEPEFEADQAARQVIGACIEVHRHMGPGFPEAAYEAELCVELALRGIAFVRQAGIVIEYKGVEVGHGRIDILVERKLVVELKAVDVFAPIHVSQVLSYLKAANLRLALLVNFNTARLRDGIKRVIYTP